ncbi:MAG: MoaD/ThiS family protein [Defluviitaleaceae bacterium]|nr:MoaD/ThiS family protein [Defluviitaleaceae bacterium]
MIKILFFALLRDKIGKSSIEIDREEISVKEIKTYISEEYNIPSCMSMLTSINEDYATDEDIVKKGDTVALIPPVGGG